MHKNDLNDGKVVLYSDGACSGNPGKGGYGTVLLFKTDNGKVHRKELSDGFRNTTNNRMELLGVIEGLKALKKESEVAIYTDSKYIVNAINKYWLKSWKKKGWINSSKKPVKNIDLWKELDSLIAEHKATFNWVKGHSGVVENEACDELAVLATQKSDLKEDSGYKAGTV